ncbi:Gametolysin peptidase M11-domain-containing protein [Haematococcus lacustris]
MYPTTVTFLLLACCCVSIGGRQFEAEVQGRLLQLDEMHPDGHHQSSYVLVTATSSVLQMAYSPLLDDTQSGDLVQMVVQGRVSNTAAQKRLGTTSSEQASSTPIQGVAALPGVALEATKLELVQFSQPVSPSPAPSPYNSLDSPPKEVSWEGSETSTADEASKGLTAGAGSLVPEAFQLAGTVVEGRQSVRAARLSRDSVATMLEASEAAGSQPKPAASPQPGPSTPEPYIEFSSAPDTADHPATAALLLPSTTSPLQSSTSTSQVTTPALAFSPSLPQLQATTAAGAVSPRPPRPPPPPPVLLPGRTQRVVTDLSTIFYLMDFCGLGGGPVASEAAFTAQLFNSSTPLQDYWSTCSLGLAAMTPENTLVVTVRLPCSGVNPDTGDSWDARVCSSSNLMRIAAFADRQVMSVMGINHHRYRHHILVMPQNMSQWMPGCTWAGNAVVGFSQPIWSHIWVSGDFWQQQQLYMHEVGHNYVLGHSNTLRGAPTTTRPDVDPNACSHCDWSSAMGYCCQRRCFNAPHAWQMGWSQAVDAIDSRTLTPGTTRIYSLPSQLSARRSFLSVTTDWAVPSLTPPSPAPPAQFTGSGAVRRTSRRLSQLRLDSNSSPSSVGGASQAAPTLTSPHTFWISWRPDTAVYDTAMPGYGNGLLIHLFDPINQRDDSDTYLMALLQPDTSKPQPVSWAELQYGSGLVVRLLGVPSNGSATVSVCRPSATSESGAAQCGDGLDNDCDGLMDLDDPDCAAFQPSPPPSPPLLPPSPPPSPSPPSPFPPLPPPSPPPLPTTSSPVSTPTTATTTISQNTKQP